MTQARKKLPAILPALIAAAALALAIGALTAQAVYAEPGSDPVKYNLWVGDTEVTSEVTRGDGWVYDGNETNGTLTLTNATITGSQGRSGYISANGRPLTIRLEGTNTVTGSNSADGIAVTDKLIIEGSGSLECTGMLYGILAYEMEIRSGSITGLKSMLDVNGGGSIRANGALSITGGEITAPYGITGGNISISEAAVTAGGKKMTGPAIGNVPPADQDAGVNGEITITDSIVSATGFSGIVKDEVTIRNTGGKYKTSVRAISTALETQTADHRIIEGAPAIAGSRGIKIMDDLEIKEPEGGKVGYYRGTSEDIIYSTVFDGEKIAMDVLIEPGKGPGPTPPPTPTPTPAKDPSGVLVAKMTAKGSRSMKVSWTKMENVDGYDIFLSKCNVNDKVFKPQLIHTVSGNKTFSWTKSGLKKRIPYKVRVKAWIMKDGKKTYVKTSPVVHAFTSGGSKGYTNAKSVKVNKTKVSMSPGQTARIKAKVKKAKAGKRLISKLHAPKLRYLSSDPKIAAVSGSGKITAKAAGSCTIYVYAPNGVYKKVSVTVQ